jgi:hypothetical protein
VFFAVLGAGLLLLSLRRRPRASRMLLAFAVGYAGMVVESALLLAYQAGVGALYRDLGLLVSLFMAGLASGAALTEKWHRRSSWAGLWSLLAALLLVGASASAMNLGGIGLWASALLLLGVGAAMGGLFAAAASGGAQGPAIGTLYASDLAGAFLGATVGGLLLLPFAGLVASLMTALGLVWLGGAAFLLATAAATRG